MSGTARLGVDVGGTRLKLGLVAARRVVARVIVPVTMTTADDLVIAIAAAADRLATDAGLRVEAVGIGVAGVLGVGGGPVLQSPNLPWLDGVDLRLPLGELLGVPVRCDNDANCVGWGEAIAGAGRGEDDQICLALGTGVGGSLITGGHLEHGSRGRGTEMGHVCVDPHGAPCGCGGRGCLEQYASQTGLLRMMTELGLPAAGPDAVPALFALAATHDPRAVQIVTTAGAALGLAIAGFARLTGVRCYVFAGGIAAALPQLLPSLTATLARYEAPPGIRLLSGQLDTDAGVIGAALLAT